MQLFQARLADNSDQPASNINPMSNLSLPDSDDMDEMVTQVLASDCVKVSLFQGMNHCRGRPCAYSF